MPIKELQFSFSIPVEELALALARSNTGMKVQVLGTEAEDVSAATPAALPPPSLGARHLVLAHMKKDTQRTYLIRELIVFCANYGFEQRNVYNTVHNMRRDGLMRRVGQGQYRLTKAGATHES